MNSVLDGRLTNNVHQRELVPHQETGGKLSQGFRDFQIFIISIMNYSSWIRNSEWEMAKVEMRSSNEWGVGGLCSSLRDPCLGRSPAVQQVSLRI